VLVQANRWWWLGWSWRVACAAYLVGLLTFLPFALLLIWWSALLFTPLVAVTLYMTRERSLATIGIPIVLAALYASIHLFYSGATRLGMPQSKVYLAVWLVGLLGPFLLFFLVSRHLASLQKTAAT
jgi:hypothetical protein